MNDTQSTIIQLLREHGALTQQQLSQRLGLSLMGINKCFATLKRDGLIEVVKNSHSGPGRPASSARLATNAGYALGVSVKHLEVELALINLQNAILDFVRVPVAFWGDLKKGRSFLPLFREIEKMLRRLPPKKLRGIGMSFSGTFDTKTEDITQANDFDSPAQADALRTQLAHRFHAPVWLVHDTETGLISERWCNRSLPLRPSLLYVQDRLGFSLMLQGKLFRSSSLWRPWLGRVQAPQAQREGPGFLPGALVHSANVSAWSERMQGFVPGTRPKATAERERAEVQKLFDLWNQRDPEVCKIVKRGLHKLALVIRNICLILPFDRVVLNGWNEGILALALRETHAVLQEGFRLHGAEVKSANPPVSASLLGERTDATGAALWAFDQYLQSRIALRGWKKRTDGALPEIGPVEGLE
jgi:predicted NBD/HSP70 family sugar kinase/biotin operon repressor